MSGLPIVGKSDLDAEQKVLWDYILNGPRGGSLIGLGESIKCLPGPFNPWMQIPSFGKLAAEMGERLRFRSVLPGNLRELAILTAGVHWKAEFEFWAHARVARAEGLPDSIIDALRAGTAVPYEDDLQRLVHAAAKTWSKQAAHAASCQRNSPMLSVGRRSSSWSHWSASTAWSPSRLTRSTSIFPTVSLLSGAARAGHAPN
jgi:alkylhydroperoxidase family enzyme